MRKYLFKSNELVKHFTNYKLNLFMMILYLIGIFSIIAGLKSPNIIGSSYNYINNILINKTFISLLILIITGVFIYLLYDNFRNLILKRNNIALIFIILTLNIVLNYLLRDYRMFILTFSFGAVLISQLLGYKIALITNIFMNLTLAILLNWNISQFIIPALSISIALMFTKETAQRSKVILCGLQIGIFSAIIYTFFILSGFESRIGYRIAIIELFLGGIASAVIALGTLPVWEKLFGILTQFRLIELSNPNQPLLKRLSMEAAGTYQHSILVGNLSEAACDAIGANSLLARVGSYYHDIGKLKRPLMFKENQFGIENPHDKLKVLQSLDIILSHRDDGISLANEYKLPREIVEFIDEHHGTTLVAYFYNKAKEERLSLPEERFRYKGRKPQSKETAIVMLADSSEAAVRSIDKIEEEIISKTIGNIIKSKLGDNQLNDSHLTIKDLSVIQEVFTNYFKGVYHQRIEYEKKLGE